MATTHLRTFGKVRYEKERDYRTGKIKQYLSIFDCEPHVTLKLKAIFTKLPQHAVKFQLPFLEENCLDLLWFCERYPLDIDSSTLVKMKGGKKRHVAAMNEMERILLPDYTPAKKHLAKGFEARDYQLKGAEVMMLSKRMILGDALGLGKSLTGTLCLLNTQCLPALIVCQSHMKKQWKNEVIEKFTDMKAHIINGYTNYQLPKADVYIINYNCLSKWIDVLLKLTKAVLFDEIQELRTGGGAKYAAAKNLCEHVKYAWGLSGSPIYNYGMEMFNILDCLSPGCLGNMWDFSREWCRGKSIADAKALGTYLRERLLFLRRTAAEVGRELPPLNTIIHEVEYDLTEVEASQAIAKQLAVKYLASHDFTIKGQLARELDARARQDTGIAKAKYVAALVRMLLETGEPVLLSGWHREVYRIWVDELLEFNPVLYTGSEGPAAKEKAKQMFMSGETDLLIISNRSGVGLDGLQHRCRYVVIGELDWSPKVHEQIIGRINRDGNEEQCTVIYPLIDYGSDPVITRICGIKAEQSHNIIDPMLAIPQQFTDESRIKLLAESYITAQPTIRVNEDGELEKIPDATKN